MKWVKSEIDQAQVRGLAKRYGIDLLDASIFARRGITQPAQVLYYLEDDPGHLRNPFLFDRMEDAVDRILLALDESEKVLVFGDGDSDGVSSTVLLTEALLELGLDVSWRIPVGDEPYGLSIEAVETFAAAGGTLIVTVDCGISNHAEVVRAAELGIDVVIADHHRLQAETPPEALAVIDPKLEDSGYPFRDLAGCGVAYKLVCALKFARSGLYKQPVALLHMRPTDSGAFAIDALKLHNLVETGRLSFLAGPQEGAAAAVKLAGFLGDRQIFVWNEKQQLRAAAELFGTSVEIGFYDVSGDVASVSPSCRGKNLDELLSLSPLGRYREGEYGEIDLFADLFAAFAHEKAGLYGSADAEALQLVALGTLADLMPLRDENRILVKRGLAFLNEKPRKGVRELLENLSLRGRPLDSHEIAWQVTPVVNAAGRMGKPDLAARLFLSDDPAERSASAVEILEANLERRKLGGEAWETVLPLARESLKANGERFALVGSGAVAPGITGLIASRVTSALKVPAVVAAFRPSGEIVGSIRSARGFPVTGLLAACADLFADYGGHDAAAGFSMQRDRWDEFARRAGEYMSNANLGQSEEEIRIDAELPHDFLKPGLKDLAARFEPYGEENRQLVLMSKNVSMVDAQIVGKTGKSHLKLTLDFGPYKWPALLWDGAERLERDFSFRNHDLVDVLFKVTVNRWNGEERPQLELYDIRKSGAKTD
ncbi:MAG: single-stranded-DNA-specific exonuclease RecJ [Rectinemataceae bacterium]